MDYQTKITIDASKAMRDLDRLAKIFQINEKRVNSLNTNVKKLNDNFKRSQKDLASMKNYMIALGTATNKSSNNVKMLNKEMTLLTSALNRNTAAMSRYSKGTRGASTSQAMLNKNLNLTTIFLRSQLIAFRAVMLAYSTWMTMKAYIEFNKVAESVDLAGRKLEMFTKNSLALDKVKYTAMKVGVGIKDLTKIITRLAITTRGAFSVDTLTKWTEGLIMSARAAGTSTMEMNNAMVQLSQSFSAGYLMGDEFRSISENLPLFKLALRDVADEAGYAGIALKELSSGRKIDIELMTKALDKLAKESMDYTFALDNIEAAEQRVKVGWELWANSVADSAFIKETLNYISGLLVNIANDGAGMSAFADAFPEMIESVESLSESILRFYDDTVLLIDIWQKFLFNWTFLDSEFRKSVFFEIENLITTGLMELPENIRTILSITITHFVYFGDYIKSLFSTIWEDIKQGFISRVGAIHEWIMVNRVNWNKLTGDDEELKILKKQLQDIQNIKKKLNNENDEIWKNHEEFIKKEEEKADVIIQSALAESKANSKRLQDSRDNQKLKREEFKQSAKIYALFVKNSTGTDRGIKKTNQLTKDQIKILKERNDVFKKLNPILSDYIEKLKEVDKQSKYLLISDEERIEKIKELRKEYEANTACDEIKVHKTCVEELVEEYDPLKKAASDYALELKKIQLASENGLSGTALSNAFIKAEEDLKKAKNEIIGIKEENTKTTKSMESEWDKLNQNIQSEFINTFTDMLTGAETSFESFAKSILKMWVNATMNMAFNPQMAGSIGGSATGISGSSFGGFDIVKDAGSFLWDGFSSAMTTNVGSLGSSIAFMGAGAGSSQAAMLAAQTAEFGLAGTSATVGALGGITTSGVMTAISAAMPYVGIALAAASAFGLFDDESHPTEMQLGIKGGLLGDSGRTLEEFMSASDGRRYGMSSVFGTMRGGITHSGEDGQISDEEARKLAESTQVLLNGVKLIDESIASSLNLSDSTIAKVKENIDSITKLDSENLSAEGKLKERLDIIADTIGGDFNNAIDLLTGKMNNVVLVALEYTNAMEDTKRLYEKISISYKHNADKIAESITNYKAVNGVLKTLKLSLYSVSIEGVKAADSLVEAAGGLANFSNLIANFYDSFYTDTEKLESITDQYSDAISEINEKYNLSLSNSADEYKEATKAILENESASSELKVAMLQLSPVASDIISLTDSLSDSLAKAGDRLEKLKESAESAVEKFKSNYEDDELDNIKDRISAAEDLYNIEMERYEDSISNNEKIKEFIDSLKISDLNNKSPLETMNEAAKLFNEAVSSGDVDDATKYGAEYLKLSKSYYGSGGDDYNDIYKSVMSAVQSMTKEISEPSRASLSNLESIQLQMENDLRRDALKEQTLDLITELNNLALATDANLLKLISENGIDLESLETKLFGELEKLNNETMEGLVQWAIDNNKTSEQLAEKFGLQYNDLITHLMSMGVTLKDILKYDMSIDNTSTLALGVMAQIAADNKWTTDTLAVQTGIEINTLRNQLADVLNTTTSALKEWDMNNISYQQNISSGFTPYSDSPSFISGNYGKYLPGIKDVENLGIDKLPTSNFLSVLSGLSTYAQGTNYVPDDQLALLHKGEAVIPAEYNLNSYGVSNTPVQSQSEIVAELRELRLEVSGLRAINASGFSQSVKEQKRQADYQEEATNLERIK